MALQLDATLTAAIEADLAEAAGKFPSGTLTWKWESTDASTIQYFAEYNDADNDLRLVIQVSLGVGPSLDYTSAEFWFEETRTVSTTQDTQHTLNLPTPSAVTLATFTTFTPVLAYIATWRDRLAGP